MAGNSPTRRSGRFRVESEVDVLRNSVVVILVVSALGVGLGLFSNSFAILFEGTFSLIDASMTIVALMVARLIARARSGELADTRLAARFTMGFWHLEPMVLALNGILLSGVAVYALINAVSSLLKGGRELEFGLALIYAVLTLTACIAIALAEARANRRIRSAFLHMDLKGWIMSASITAALLVAFCIGYGVQGTRYEWISPYIDPAVLAVVCAVIIPLPLSVIRQALSEMLLVTPADLKQHVDSVAQAFVERYRFASYRAYVAKVGRSQEIELYFIVPSDMPARTVAAWDSLRDEIGNALGADSPDRWLTVVFTGDPEWAE